MVSRPLHIRCARRWDTACLSELLSPQVLVGWGLLSADDPVACIITGNGLKHVPVSQRCRGF